MDFSQKLLFFPRFVIDIWFLFCVTPLKEMKGFLSTSMSQGALSRHLFHWKSFNLKPLSWTRRLIILLDVARAMEYLHNLACQTFIHLNLKSSNILLGDDFHAEVSDFRLVKLTPDGEKSVVAKLAGTFGYLAPEYALMGKITTKADVFSFGVVYLAEWFWQIKSSKEKLVAAIDPTLEVKEETFESISIIAELAGHCTAREPSHRPEMGHAVNVLSLLVEKWKPVEDESDCLSGIDYNHPLPQMTARAVFLQGLTDLRSPSLPQMGDEKLVSPQNLFALAALNHHDMRHFK
ncbi:unnamed protein product [Malus baccata var. baccata]